MRRHLTIFCTLLLLAFPASVLAVGVPSGTVITNQAQVSALVNGNPVNKISNPAFFTVDEVLDLTLTWQDTTNIIVLEGDINQMLTFLLSNTGNGTEAFNLTVDNAISGDQFNPQNPSTYLDTNGNGSYDPGIDQAYDSSTNLPTLTADQGVNLFVFNDIPNGLNDGNLGTCRLIATAETGSGTPGTAFPPTSPGDPHSIVGASGARASDDGLYEITKSMVTLRKSVQIDDPDGGNQPISGATLTYSVLVEVTGTDTATGLVVLDQIPTDTSFVPGSMTLVNGTTMKTLTDPVDADEGAYIENPVGSGNFEVTYNFGDLTNTTRTVTFQVTID
jgi:uncharacterized repeat protein (TIGR01451 family)